MKHKRSIAIFAILCIFLFVFTGCDSSDQVNDLFTTESSSSSSNDVHEEEISQESENESDEDKPVVSYQDPQKVLSEWEKEIEAFSEDEPLVDALCQKLMEEARSEKPVKLSAEQNRLTFFVETERTDSDAHNDILRGFRVEIMELLQKINDRGVTNPCSVISCKNGTSGGSQSYYLW